MVDPKRLVAGNYDQIADAYLERFGISTVRRRWLDRLIARLPSRGSQIIDLGCGAGIPVARDLAALGHSVIGIDGSAEQITRARRNVPDGTFVQGDMCEVELEADAFDGVCAFYSITHVPAADHGRLFAKIAGWLKPGGVFVASFGAGPAGDWTGEWLGTTMFFSGTGTETTLKQIRDAGLVVCESRIEQQDNEDAAFLWVLAVK